MQLEADNFCEEIHGWDTWMGDVLPSLLVEGHVDGHVLPFLLVGVILGCVAPERGLMKGLKLLVFSGFT